MRESLQFDTKWTKFEAVAEFFCKDSMIWFMRVKPQRITLTKRTNCL